MKLNIYIIFDELYQFFPIMLDNEKIDLTLEQIRFFPHNAESLRQDYIYLATAEQLSNLSYIPHNANMIILGQSTQTDATNSIIVLPSETDINTIYDLVQDIFQKYNKWNNDLMLDIASNSDLQTIADHATTVLHNPIAIFDISSALLLKSGQMPENYKGSVWELVLENGYMPYEILSYDKQNILKSSDANLWRNPTLMEEGPYSDFDNIVVGVRLDDKLFGMIGSTSINTAFTKGQTTLMSYVRDIIELSLKNNLLFKNSMESPFYFLDNLIKGIPVDEKIIFYHLGTRGWSNYGDFRLYHIADYDGESLSESQIQFCLYRIDKIDKDPLSFAYENAVNIVTQNSNDDGSKRFEKRLGIFLHNSRLHCGRSMVYGCFSDLKYYYIQAKTAFYEGTLAKSADTFIKYEDYYLSHIIRTLDHSTSLKSICHPAILRLNDHDIHNSTDYIKCLSSFLSNGCNMAQTAKNLFMHRNTLEYRMDKVIETLGISISELNETTRMHLWLSCQICNFII